MCQDKPKAFEAYANSFQAVTVPGLLRIRLLCGKLGDPQKGQNYIHVAGTNGKGSVVAFLSEILQTAGYKTGKFTSPNLLRVNERISVNGEEISDPALSALLLEIEPHAKAVGEETGLMPTQFEIWTAAAFLYFKRQGCDYVVLEVGLGGEFDATNLIDENKIAVLTRLDLDHTEYLGPTLSSVAQAKCGILKPHTNGHVVTVLQESEAMSVIEEAALKADLPLHVVSPTSVGRNGFHERFALASGDAVYESGLAGLHQIENAALAVRAAELLGIDERAIQAGLLSARHPARLELLDEETPLLYDGAHNPNGISSLVLSLDRYLGDRERCIVFACMKDKDILPSLRMLSPHTRAFFFTEVKHNPRALSAASLQKLAEGAGIRGKAYPEIGDAVAAAKEYGLPIVICGSLYLYKDLKEAGYKKEKI